MSRSSQSDKVVRSIANRTPTPTKPPFPGKGAPSITSSQNAAGSVRTGGLGTGTLWKARVEDDNIPSDDSDPGDKSPFGAKPRTRIRKRRVTRTGAPPPVSAGMPAWISKRSISATSSNTIVPPNPPVRQDSATSTIGKRSHVKELFPSIVSKQNNDASRNQVGISPPGEVASNSSDSSVKNQKSAKPRLQGKKRDGETSNVLTSNTNQPPKNIVNQNSRREITKNNFSEDWTFYSVWFPAWDIIWKCANKKIPLKRNKSFTRLVKDIVLDNAGSELHVIYDLSVMKVQIVGNIENSFKTIGILQTNSPPKGKRKIEWKPLPPMGKLVEAVASRGDIIVQCTPKNPPASISKRKTCIVHLTPKDGNNIDFHILLNPSDVQLAIYSIDYDHYFPRVVKCSPFWGKSLNPTEVEQRQLSTPVIASTTANLTIENVVPPPPPPKSPDSVVAHPSSASQNNAELSTGLPRAASNCTATPLGGGEGSNSDEIPDGAVIENVSTTSSSKGAQMNGHHVEDEMEESSSDTNTGKTNDSSQNMQSASNEFSLETFFQNGNFVPGPLRPKVKKSKGDAYVYNTLAELRLMLRASIREDVSKKVVPNMIVKRPCNTYGVVVEVVSQFRHENAHYVRISDETRKSVLLRIHTDAKDNFPGPTIEVGNIIRIHRLTVQMEWDVDAGKNTMVLSTFAHRNYVLFEQSNEAYQFYFNASAKTITLTEYDNKRVGELQLFKVLLSKSNKGVDYLTPRSVISEGNEVLNSQVDALSSSKRDDVVRVMQQDNGNQSEGIYESDLASPPLTLSNTNESVDSEIINVTESPIPVNGNNDRLVLSPSDESFFSATDDVVENNFSPNSRSTNQAQAEIACNPSELVHAPPSNNAHCTNFTLFKNLTKTEEPFNFLCQIITLCGSLDGTAWKLTVRDLEHTVPSDDFKMIQPIFVNQQSCHNCLLINITNANVYEDGDIIPMLYDAQGSHEVFSIENVRVNGVSPPYGLEVVSDVCEIKKYSYFSEFVDSFSEPTNNTINVPNSVDNTSKSRLEAKTTSDQEEAKDQPDQDLQESFLSEPVDQPACIPVLPPPENNNNNQDGGSAIAATSDTEESAFETARPSPSHSPVRATRKRTHDGKLVEQKWTGRLRHKRKPREHYQPEDSFEC